MSTGNDSRPANVVQQRFQTSNGRLISFAYGPSDVICVLLADAQRRIKEQTGRGLPSKHFRIDMVVRKSSGRDKPDYIYCDIRCDLEQEWSHDE